MPHGGRITIATRSRAGVAEVSVTDTGEGISPDDCTRIFDPFFTTRSPLRAGLGLAVVQGIAARHGGRIDVRTHPGRGTTLMITGWGDLLDLDGMRERRVDLVLVKPFTMERVLGAVAESLAQRRPRA